MAACTRGLLARGAEAIVFGGGATPVDPGRNRPWASLDEPVSRSALPGSGFDCAGALALAARYLQGLGHVRIGLLGVGGEHRSDAVRRALADTGIQIVEDAFAGKAGTGDGLGDVFDRWRTLAAPPTAVVCGSDRRRRCASCRNASGRTSRCPGNYRSSGTAIPSSRGRYARRCPRFGCPRARQVQPWPAACSRSWTAASEPSPELHPKLVVRESTGRTRLTLRRFHVEHQAWFHVEPQGRSLAERTGRVYRESRLCSIISGPVRPRFSL